jgi:pimeloyl-ACP methyl ester carboxylesterase
VFHEVIAKLDEAPLTVPSASPGSAGGVKMIIDGTRFQQAVLQALYSSLLIPEIPKGIYAARYGDYTFLEAALASPRMHHLDASIGGMLSQNCREQVYATSPAELEADLESISGASTFARYSIYGSADLLFGICDLWYAAPRELENKVPFSSTIPTLVLNGQFDPVAPAYLGEQLAGNFHNATQVVLPALGHAPSAVRGQECPLSLAAVFLYDPSSDLDPVCGLEVDLNFAAR